MVHVPTSLKADTVPTLLSTLLHLHLVTCLVEGLVVEPSTANQEVLVLNPAGGHVVSLSRALSPHSTG